MLKAGAGHDNIGRCIFYREPVRIADQDINTFPLGKIQAGIDNIIFAYKEISDTTIHILRTYLNYIERFWNIFNVSIEEFLPKYRADGCIKPYLNNGVAANSVLTYQVAGTRRW